MWAVEIKGIYFFFPPFFLSQKGTIISRILVQRYEKIRIYAREKCKIGENGSVEGGNVGN